MVYLSDYFKSLDPSQKQKEMEMTENYVRFISDRIKRDDVFQYLIRIYAIRKELRQKLNVDNKLKKIGYTDVTDFNTDSYTSLSDTTIGIIEHLLSLPYAPIQNYRFSNGRLGDIIHTLRDYEKEWKASASQWIDITDDLNSKVTRTVLKFDDGFEWQIIDKNYCEREGSAMGHCGNRGNPKNGDVIYSLRKIQNKKNRTFARPSLTFIYNYIQKAFGEMKGRENNKPNIILIL